MIYLSKHVSLIEATKSVTAIKYGIDNTPDNNCLSNMKSICNDVFEPLRAHFKVAIGISSFFRNEELNEKVGGSSSSQHVLGMAMDLDADIFGKITNQQIFDYIKNNLKFDQLIWEFGDDSNPAWIHVSYNKSSNRGQILKSYFKNGKKIHEAFQS